MIIVKPTAGLCNRMRVLNSCIEIQKLSLDNSNCIKMIWEKNELLNCEFAELFKPINYIEIIGSHKLLNYFLNCEINNMNSLKGRLKKIYYANKAKKYKFFNDEIIKPYRFKEEFWKKNYENLVFHTCQDFVNSDIENNFSMFEPVSELQFLIDNQVKKFSANTFGVHIRGTDNEKSKLISKTNLFIKEIKTILNKDSNTMFYLATDEPTIESNFFSEFGTNICVQENKDLNRDSKKGIKDALVDLYSLSNTNHILGSYWSSFSKVAANIKRIPLTIIK